MINGSDEDTDSYVCDCVRLLLPTISADDADMIDRIDLRGEPREKVAAMKGISIASLDVHLRRARQILKQRFVEMCMTCPKHGILDCDCDIAERAKLLRKAAIKRSEL